MAHLIAAPLLYHGQCSAAPAVLYFNIVYETPIMRYATLLDRLSFTNVAQHCTAGQFVVRRNVV
jgi:hypothetical protein